MKIIFMGTPKFGAIILDKLVKGKYKPVLVITAPDKPVGKVIAEKYKIPVEQPEKIESRSQQEKIENCQPDLIAVVAYGQILPKEILEIPKHGCLNVHPSLLPKYRGSSPIQAAILNGDKTTGATIILMDEKMDHGPIFSQRTITIEEGETAITLQEKLADLGAGLLMETISKRARNIIKPKTQDDSQATFTKVLTKIDGRINWQKSAQELEREVRAFYPWPGSYTFWEKTGKSIQIKILKARVYQSPAAITYLVGKTLVAPQNELAVQCGKGYTMGAGDFLVIERLQMEGKKEMTSEEFLRGYPSFIGVVLK
jgi:methionyl-tRNA formyltransferase